MRHPQGSTAPDESLVVRLRELKDRTGLSLAALAARTPYSKSAWHRYLSGGKRPPRPAVEALCRLADADPAAVLALWETADGPAPPGPSEEHAEARRSSWPPLWLPVSALALFGAATAVAAAVALSGRPGSAPVARPMGEVPRCHRTSCQGELPDASVCARDAQTRSTVTDPAYAVRLRYSPSCGTAWSEVRMRSPRAREVSVRAGDAILSASYPADDVTSVNSPMLPVGSPRGVEACAEMGGKVACTGLDAGRPPGDRG
ncbi:XRE family transcriptional regulator [Streptomyces sp. NPDC014983]|uniref:XRE family transcriptional regulator n=1 Tax=Streptomyces sp. NPDC014983 TaxID=3364933 RepID=UPI0036FEB72E